MKYKLRSMQMDDGGHLLTVMYCLNCGHRFFPRLNLIQAGFGNFCCHACASSYRLTGEDNPSFGSSPAIDLKSRCHQSAKSAMRSRRIPIKYSCEFCGKTDKQLDKHHPDYGKPLEVVWLCRSCHVGLHNET